MRPGNVSDIRDLFLSHRSTAKDFVRRLAADVESESFNGRPLRTWVDEAEIRPGESIPRLVNRGLETSRFIGLVMSPDYFDSVSGWTDAEWHAALHVDPDNRRGRVVPILPMDCPYIPALLIHLNTLDFRGGRYRHALDQLLGVLREEPLPRPVAVRGQLIRADGRVSRTTVVAERSVLEAAPDACRESLYCNLVPVEQLPRYVYSASLSRSIGDRSKAAVIQEIRSAQLAHGAERPFTPAFRLLENRIVTFHDLEDPESVLAPVIDGESVEVEESAPFLEDEDDRRLLISLLNMALARHARRVGLAHDTTSWQRFFFPPTPSGGPRIITWRPRRMRATRTVAKPCRAGDEIAFWRHLAAYLQMIYLRDRLFLQIQPTWVLTDDGVRVRTGPGVGRLVNRWTNPERNLHVLFHVRFWTMTLRGGRPGPISVRAGDQRLELSTTPAFIRQEFGIAGDQGDLLGLLDQEAQLLGEDEEKMLDEAVESVSVALEMQELESSDENEDEWSPEPVEHDEDALE